MSEDRRSPYFIGGTPTGRLSRQPIPAVLPSGEYVVPRRDVPVLDIDYGVTETRVLTSLYLPFDVTEAMAKAGRSAAEATEKVRRFNQVMELHASRIREKQERHIMMAIFGPSLRHLVKTPPDTFKLERRIANLLLSDYRRKVKRGERLFKKWRLRSFGLNLHRYWKD